jgi:iron complex outermembrane recepter protein
MMKDGFLTASSIAAILLTQPALAQTSADAASSQDSRGLDDIVVTAQRRAENLQVVPLAVTALTGNELSNKAIFDTQDLVAVVPGYTARATQIAFQPYIRGVGTSAAFVENPAALYIDDVYVPDQRNALVDLADVEQISVLKGPQGTLFGRNSTAGVIQIVTRQPKQELEGFVRAGIDNYETLRTNFYVTGGLTPKIAASLSASYLTQGEGYGTNLTTGEAVLRQDHNFDIRGKLKLDPTDTTSILLIGQYSHSRREGLNSQPYPGTSFAYPGFAPMPSVYDSRSNANRDMTIWGHAFSMNIKQEIGSVDLTLISAYSYDNSSSIKFDADSTAAPLFQVDIPNTPSHSFSQEARLSSTGSGPLTWQLGAYYFNNTNEVNPSVSTIYPPFFPAPAGAVLTRIGKERAESIAGFVQATWEFTADTKLTGGIRYTYEERKFNGLQTVAVGGGPARGAPTTGELSVNEPTYRISLDHQFGADALGYISFNRGFKSGGFNVLSPTQAPYAPETLDSYETGLKTELFNRSLRLNTAVFYYDYKNIQVFQIVNNVSTISNAAKARLYGLDLDMTAQLTKQLTLTGGLALMNAKFSEYDNAQIAIPKVGGGFLITSGSAKGNRTPLAQNVSGYVAADYDTVALDADMHFNVTASYQGDYYFEPDNFQRQAPYVLLNASFKVTPPNSNLSVTIWGRNLCNEVVQTFGSTNAFGATAYYESPPRTFGATAQYNF